jgi:superfamily II DNA or RNA helicase
MVKMTEKNKKQNGGETRLCTPKLKQDTVKLLCDKDKKELTYSDIKRGLVKYHPDKNLGANKEDAIEKYKIINNAKDECFEGKNDTKYVIKCGVKYNTVPTPPPPRGAPKAPKAAPKAAPKPKPVPTINKHAECIRQVGTFTHVTPEFKVDKRTFAPEKLKEELPVVSPKLVALIEKIEELDKADLAKDQKNYKHCIYIDFKGTYAKVVAAAMIAHGYNMAFDRNMTVDEAELLDTKGNNFAFLSSSTIYDKTMKVPFRKQLVELFNRRPDNINGDYIKYIVLDSGFREGLDLFDTKYCHIIQDLPSAADERQAIGRNTRLCGQAGLKFHPTKGWPLEVYKYDIELPDHLQEKYNGERMFDLFLKYNNIDVREIRFAMDLDKMITEVAVDQQLTKNIHEFTIKKDNDLEEMPRLNWIASNPEPGEEPESGAAAESSIGLRRLFGLRGGSKKHRGQSRNLHPKPPLTKKDFPTMYKYIAERFSAYKWPPAKMENKCAMEGGKPKLITLNETQNFLRFYYQPSSAYKGILLDHSVGSGKTCSSIAIASTAWETAGYTILYVTRHTLKADVYKNMFRQVCSQTMKRKIQKGEVEIPDGKIQSPSRLLPENWFQPISFKQFSNACSKKNDVYRELKKRNGEADPFNKTLIIIDEAHKIYASDVIGSERPDVGAITEAIQNSYKISGKDSARLLLMTATPYTTNPMDMMKLVNLMKEPDEQLPVVFNDFYKDNLADDGSFSTAGKRFTANALTGYISYLNRSNDARQFAYPIFHQELVPMSLSDSEQKKEELYNALRKIYQLKAEIDGAKVAIQRTKRDYKARIEQAKAECADLPKPERKDCELENVEPLKDEAVEAVNRIKETTENKKDELQKMKSTSKKLAHDIKNAVKTDFSQEFVLNNKCNLPTHSHSGTPES